MADPFATKDDYVALWPLKASLEARCTAFLAKASRKVRATLTRAGRDIDAEIAAATIDVDLVKDVVLDIVHRALQAADGSDDTIPAKAVQQSWGPFQQSITPTNPGGDLYLTKENRRDLGLGGQRAYSVDLILDESSSSSSSSSSAA